MSSFDDVWSSDDDLIYTPLDLDARSSDSSSDGDSLYYNPVMMYINPERNELHSVEHDTSIRYGCHGPLCDCPYHIAMRHHVRKLFSLWDLECCTGNTNP